MASAGFRIEVTVEDAEVRAKLARLIAKVRHPARAKIGEVLSARTRKRFETESGSDGGHVGAQQRGDPGAQAGGDHEQEAQRDQLMMLLQELDSGRG